VSDFVVRFSSTIHDVLASAWLCLAISSRTDIEQVQYIELQEDHTFLVSLSP
jgi:hypothetical protein